MFKINYLNFFYFEVKFCHALQINEDFLPPTSIYKHAIVS